MKVINTSKNMLEINLKKNADVHAVECYCDNLPEIQSMA